MEDSDYEPSFDDNDSLITKYPLLFISPAWSEVGIEELCLLHFMLANEVLPVGFEN